MTGNLCEKCNEKEAVFFVASHKGYTVELCWECHQDYQENLIDSIDYHPHFDPCF